MVDKLSQELIDAYNNTGGSSKEKRRCTQDGRS